MTDQLGSQRCSGEPSSVERGETASVARPRRRYARPELTEFGTVRDLTRGASGTARDSAGKKRRVN